MKNRIVYIVLFPLLLSCEGIGEVALNTGFGCDKVQKKM